MGILIAWLFLRTAAIVLRGGWRDWHALLQELDDAVLPAHERRMATIVAIRLHQLLDGLDLDNRGVHAFDDELKLHFLTGPH